MDLKFKEDLEKFISDYHWDKSSKIYAYELGKVLFSFLIYLKGQDLKPESLRKHRSNLSIIGFFVAKDAYHDKFQPEDILDYSFYLSEFKIKISDSAYAIQSFKSTGRALNKYIESKQYKKYLPIIVEKLEAPWRTLDFRIVHAFPENGWACF